jgi:ABC-type branched-subunit amino acid transport system substrate-binding protein
LFGELRDRLEDAGVVMSLSAPYSETDVRSAVETAAPVISRTGSSDVVWLGRIADLREAIVPLRRAAPQVRILASDGVDGRELIENRSGLYTGVQYVCFVDVGSARAPMARFRDRYRARTGHTPTAELAFNYDAVMLIAAAARESGVRRRAIFLHVTSLGRTRPPFRGATGDIAFNEDGEPPPSYCLAEVTPGGVRVRRGAGDKSGCSSDSSLRASVSASPPCSWLWRSSRLLRRCSATYSRTRAGAYRNSGQPSAS